MDKENPLYLFRDQFLYADGFQSIGHGTGPETVLTRRALKANGMSECS